MIAAQLLALVLCISQSPVTQRIMVDVEAEPVNEISALSVDGESWIYGFEIDSDVFDVNWTTRDIKVSYNSAYCGLLRVNIGGVRMIEKLSNGQYAYGVLIHAIMSPQEFTLTSNGTSYSYRGRSRYLDITASTSSSQTLLTTQPENTSGTTSYTIGVSLNAGTSGVNVGISASTEISSSSLEIVNSSNIGSGTVDISYQYNRHFWPWNWENTYYCWNESVQRSAFFFSSSSIVSSKSVKFMPTFAIDEGDIGMWNREMGYEITATSYVSASFPN